MELVGARLDDGVDDGAVAPAEFRAVGVGLDFEFLQSFNRGLDDEVGFVEQVGEVGIVVDAVEQEVVLQRTRAVGAEAEATLVAGAGLAGSSAGSEQGELGEIAAIEGKVGDALAINDLTEFGSLGLKQGGGAGHQYFLGQQADLQRHVDGDAALHVQFDGLGDSLLEAALLDSDGVTAHAQRAGDELADLVGGGAEGLAAFDVGHRDARTGHDRAGWVFDRADNAAGVFLREAEGRHAEQKEGRSAKGETGDGHKAAP